MKDKTLYSVRSQQSCHPVELGEIDVKPFLMFTALLVCVLKSAAEENISQLGLSRCLRYSQTEAQTEECWYINGVYMVSNWSNVIPALLQSITTNNNLE